MKKYLVWINLGGEQGNWVCYQEHYKVCEGNTEEDAVKDWLRQLNKDFYNDNTKFSHGMWNCFGREIVLFELKESFKENEWKTLSWN